MPSFIMREFECAACGERIESLQDRASQAVQVEHFQRGAPCGLATRIVSAPMVKIPLASVPRGTGKDRPPHALDTRDLGDGMPIKEWRKRRRKVHSDARYAQVKALL